ncbi:methyl-CpG-binding domain protein 2 isoform X2 [Lycorma delicatula]|uniref:methyl-CpG-binding domain protein 2 isoform X2 n=1 Tax=Lycorma delicatula TaxID=130591 RepID=UPI003F510461
MLDKMSVERKRFECSALPKGWQREEVVRKSGLSAGKVDVYYYSRGVRSDASLVPPIRQTASIFKQPVTVIKQMEGKVKTEFKHGGQEKPKQLFWEKRLEGMRPCDTEGNELHAMELPKGLKAVGPHVTEETLLQSVATALHVSNQPITGQTGSKTALEKNPGVFINPDQPLVQAVAVGEEDIKRQEERVSLARKKLEEALKNLKQ